LPSLLSILIPYKSDGGPRDAVFQWVVRYYRTMFPAAEICIGDPGSGDFSRARAINAAARKATRDIFLISDADVVISPSAIFRALELLDRYAWVIPYNRVLNLSETITNQLLATEPVWPLGLDLEFSVRNKRNVGGMNVVPRRAFEKVRGFDEGFVDWGGQDGAFYVSLNTLCGPNARLEEDLIHLWHPPSLRRDNAHYANNLALYHRYRRRKGQPDKMLKFIDGRRRRTIPPDRLF
jgi:Glycosyltransferases, probably involved in cell wall biogenesis